MTIRLHDVRNSFETLFSSMERAGIHVIDTDIDYYWTIPLGDAYETKAPEVSVGSLVDDLESLRKVLNKKNPSTTIDFERLGNVITILGHVSFMPKKPLAHKQVQIQVREIKQLCDLLLQKATASGFEEVTFSQTQYWNIDCTDACDFSRSPIPQRRSLSEDWEKLVNAKQVSAEFLESIGRVLKVIGEAIHTSNNKINWLLHE